MNDLSHETTPGERFADFREVRTEEAKHQHIERIERVNECGVWMTEFVVGGKIIGRLFRTKHPQIEFEVFNEPPYKSHRCNSVDDAEKWLSSGGAKHSHEDQV